MRRGPKPAKSKEAKPPVARKSPTDDGAKVLDLEKRLAEAEQREAEALKREAEALKLQAEAQEQQTATSEILRVISQSPTEVQPVFDAIVRTGAHLCGADYGFLARYDGTSMTIVAHSGATPEEIEAVFRVYPMSPAPDSLGGRTILERAVIQIPDVRTDPTYGARVIQDAGWRTGLGVPLLREGAAIGLVGMWRRDVRPFSDRQIELLKVFAAQAVLAINNVRLFNEIKEALEQQTATSEILGVISSSPTDAQPVFEAIVRSAVLLCGAMYGSAVRFDGELMHLAAGYNYTPEVAQALHEAFPMRPSSRMMSGRAILARDVVEVEDALEDSDYAPGVAPAGGFRSMLAAPMLRDGRPIGAIVVNRGQPGRFSPAQIALLKTFADQAVIAIENVRLFKELEARNKDLAEALDQQTATGGILSVIASSPTNIQPVFDAIAEAAMRLCGAHSSLVTTFDGELLHLVAQADISPEGREAVRDVYPRGPIRGFASGRSVLTRRIVQIPDLTADPEFDVQVGAVVARVRDFRSILAVPMLRDGLPIGTINAHKAQPGPFTDKQVALLQTFADQAVIAIENVRLFKELEARNRDLTATGEILGVISSSPTNVQPVFETLVRNAQRLLGAYSAGVFRRVGDDVHVAAYTTTDVGGDTELRSQFPMPLSEMTRDNPVLTRVWTVGDIQHDSDIESDPRLPERVRRLARARGFRSRLVVPMRREGFVIGLLVVTRHETGGFADGEIELLKTFADQAVIAIENVRLFTELQASNRELTTALDTQTATSDILRVISRSQTDVQPVFDAIVASAVRLLEADSGLLTRIAGDQIEIAALTSTDPAGDAILRAAYPLSRHSDRVHARVIRDRAPLNVADSQTDPRLPDVQHATARARGYRSQVAVPLLRHDEALGAIAVTRHAPGGFTDDEIALLQTFADQAVIAIENARLLSELQARTAELTRSVEELRALGEVGQAISSTLDLRTVLSTIVARATQLSGTDAGVVYEYDEQGEIFVPRATQHLEAEIVETMLTTPVRKGEGATGRLAETQEPIQVPDILAAPAESRVRGALVRAGYRALLAVPLVRDDRLLGGLTVIRKATGEFAPEVIDLLRTFATQSALAIQNARLFREIEDKSRQLEVASQHKSEFLANMSHELRTPLNAIIGFSEVLSERMFGELNEKQEEYLKDIYASGTHLLSLINDILDLSKIEAGRMELELTDFHLPTALDSALTLVRERAGRRSIALQMNVDSRLGQIQADERKVRQVVLNLLSNAIKFTPEGGRIEVGAVPKAGLVEVSVSDTGVGIAPEDQEAVFEEFRQVGTADKKVEGTGLGLTLCRKFVELHGGRIWVKSEVGVGSTFTFTIPVRAT
jgi:GAF domain-containing protein